MDYYSKPLPEFVESKRWVFNPPMERGDWVDNFDPEKYGDLELEKYRVLYFQQRSLNGIRKIYLCAETEEGELKPLEMRFYKGDRKFKTISRKGREILREFHKRKEKIPSKFLEMLLGT